MDLLEILVVFALVALVMVTSFTLPTQHNAEAAENQEGEQGNGHDIEGGLQKGGDMGDARDEQGPTSLQLVVTPNRHEERSPPESPVVLLVANLKTEGQEEEHIGEVAPRLDVQLPSMTNWSVMNAKVIHFGSKIGFWATGISVPGIIAILTIADRNRRTSLCHSLLLLASILAMLASFISGGVLMIFSLFHVKIFPPNDPKSIRKIKIIIGIAITSMALVVSFMTSLIFQGSY